MFEEGTLTWDNGNGLRLHDGSTEGGNPVGGFSGNFYDLNNRPNGNTALSDLIGGSGSNDNGKFYQQTSTGVTNWAYAVPVWKSGINVSNPEVAAPIVTISYYANDVRIINSSGSNSTYVIQGRKVTAAGVVTTISQTVSINATEFYTVGSLAGSGDILILDALYDAGSNVVYRVTVMAGYSGGTMGQICIEQLI